MSGTPLQLTAFFQAGATLPADAPSYIERRADREFLESLLRGECCCLLDPSQSGKSSLLQRTRARLRERGIDACLLDLSFLAGSASLGEWYSGLVDLASSELTHGDHLRRIWRETAGLPLVQRFFRALHETFGGERRATILLDEIGAVRMEGDPGDTFFAGLRAFVNESSAGRRGASVAFGLAGSVHPIELRRDPGVAPFNIGARVELSDFTWDEAQVLLAGLREATGGRLHEGRARAVLRRVLWWTAGQPYLTQRLCLLVAGRLHGLRRVSFPGRLVDAAAAEAFLNPGDALHESNLATVHHAVLASSHRADRLLVYRRILEGERVNLDPSNATHEGLRISGLVRIVESGDGRPRRLQIRNRIYARVFGRQWIERCLGQEEWFRQNQAYRRRNRRAVAAAAAVVAMSSSVTAWSLRLLDAAHQGRERADRLAADLRRQRGAQEYALRMRAVQAAFDSSPFDRQRAYRALTELHLPEVNSGGTALLRDASAHRQFEWGYWWRLCIPRGEDVDLPYHGGEMVWDAEGFRVMDQDHSLVFLDGDFQQVQKHRAPLSGGIAGSTFSISGDWVAWGTVDGRVLLRATRSLREKRLGAAVRAIAADPAGRYLAAITATEGADPEAERLLVLDAASLAPRWEAPLGPRASGRPAWRLQVSPTGRFIWATGETTRLWLSSGEEHVLVRGGAVTAVGMSRDDGLAAFGTADGRVLVRAMAGGPERELDPRTLPSQPIRVLAWNPDGSLLAGAGDDRRLYVWDIWTGGILHRFAGHLYSIGRLAWSPDGLRIATATGDGTASSSDGTAIWDLRKGQLPKVLEAGGPIRAIAVNADGTRIAVACGSSRVRIWNLDRVIGAISRPTGDVVRKYSRITRFLQSAPLQIGPEGVACLAWSTTGSRLAFGTGAGKLGWIDPGSGRVAAVTQAHQGPVVSLAWSPDGACLASGGQNGDVREWAGEAGTPSRRVLWRSVAVRALAWSPTARWLAWGGDSEDSTRRAGVWDLRERRTLRYLSEHSGSVTGVAFPRDDLVLTAGTDRLVRFWNLSGLTTRQTVTIPAHTTGISASALSADSRRFATGSYEGVVRLWDTSTAEETLTLRAHAGPVTAIAWADRDRLLVTAGEDGKIRLWEADGREADTPLP